MNDVVPFTIDEMNAVKFTDKTKYNKMRKIYLDWLKRSRKDDKRQVKNQYNKVVKFLKRKSDPEAYQKQQDKYKIQKKEYNKLYQRRKRQSIIKKRVHINYIQLEVSRHIKIVTYQTLDGEVYVDFHC